MVATVALNQHDPRDQTSGHIEQRLIVVDDL
jgi:hypothetical protein